VKLLIIGGSRGVGRSMLECAVRRGFDVTVLARFPEKIEADESKVTILKGDVLNKEDLASAVHGQEAVCSCIGVAITFKPVSLFSRAAENIVEVMENNTEQKFVAVTGIGAGDSKGHGGFLYDKIFKPIFLSTIYQDKDREEEIIRSSALDWLIVRPAGLTNGTQTGKYRVIDNLDGIVAKRISRMDVADFILNQIEEPSQFGKAVLLTY
jgi:putative NADH-flavin reductase